MHAHMTTTLPPAATGFRAHRRRAHRRADERPTAGRAGLTEPEPLPADHPLWTAPGLFLCPHAGGSVPGRLERSYRIAADQIAAFVRGEKPPNLVRDGY